MTAEQAKAESTQRSLEEERRALSMQINMEREELERAKVRPMNHPCQILVVDKGLLSFHMSLVSIRAHYWRSRNR